MIARPIEPPTAPPTISATFLFELLAAAVTVTVGVSNEGVLGAIKEVILAEIERVSLADIEEVAPAEIDGVETEAARGVESSSPALAISIAALILNTFCFCISMYAQAGTAVPYGMGLGNLSINR